MFYKKTFRNRQTRIRMDEYAHPTQTGMSVLPKSAIRRGFSLLEVLMVLVIMGMVAGLITANVHSRMMLAKQNMARTEIASVVDALESFHLVYGRYPTNDEGLEILTRTTEKCPEPLLHANLQDPWGRKYEYVCPGQQGRTYEVVCLGADGIDGGNGADQDIVSWDLKEKHSGP